MSLRVEKLDLQKADISGSKWQEVRGEELDIDNVSLAKTKINNVNMSEMTLNDVNMSGIKISDANFSHAIIATSICLEQSFIMWFFLWRGTEIIILMGNINQ
ncbi:pentapeptide repeat-containing protein [Lysinibacillus sp. Bpr_S20]|uniref:pentapeptide repeat-containing protein n=1 Tax=Lysinibacillus sp. Bpr_S20 TaxID=2933964 RepID=UPI002011DAEC|nr:pentapeptide repeat-containing protein [Lysinibacillus sp. Bpr_S20]MCL1701510.1 pentapeptide repeat-containing protein [Lysinibacillus sp. Bpr_S20]